MDENLPYFYYFITWPNSVIWKKMTRQPKYDFVETYIYKSRRKLTCLLAIEHHHDKAHSVLLCRVLN